LTNFIVEWLYKCSDYYYRLKMVNKDGSADYSKTVLVRFNGLAQIKVFPAVFTSSLTVRILSVKEEMMQLTLMDLSGKTVYQRIYKAKQGINEFSIEPPPSLGRGQYFVMMGNSNQPVGVIKR
jgi:hypothetical protein